MGILQRIISVRYDKTIRFKMLATEWLEQKKNTIKQSTYCNYMFIIEKHLLPEFEEMRLKQLEKYNYNKYIHDLSMILSKKTTRDIMNVLKAILKYTNSKYHTDVFIQDIILPKLEVSSLNILNKKEKNRLIKHCFEENSLKSLGIIICLNTGLRIGEICALKWKDIDMENRTINVKKTLQRVYIEKKSSVIIDIPKTRTSIRSIPMSDKLYKILQPIQKHYKKEDFFLTGSQTKFLEPRSYQYIYKCILKESNVKPYKFHILRHTFATNCIEVGMDPKSLSEILGHSNVNITLNRYVHSSYKIKKKYLEKLE